MHSDMYFVVESVLLYLRFKGFPVFGLLWFMIVMYFMLKASRSLLKAFLNDDKDSSVNNSQNSSRSTKLAGMGDGDYINEYGMVPPRMSRTIIGDNTPVAPYVSVTTPAKVQPSTDTSREQPQPFTRIEDLEPIDWEGSSNENTSTESNNNSSGTSSVVRSFDVNRASDFRQVFYTDFLAERTSSIDSRASKRDDQHSLNHSVDQSLWFSSPVDYSDELDEELDSGNETITSSSAY